MLNLTEDVPPLENTDPLSLGPGGEKPNQKGLAVLGQTIPLGEETGQKRRTLGRGGGCRHDIWVPTPLSIRTGNFAFPGSTLGREDE